MSVQLKLASQLHANNLTLAQLLARQIEQQRKDRVAAEKTRIESEIKQIPIIANKLIAGLPDFLQQLTNQGDSKAYVVCRSGCRPYENDFPNFQMRGIPDFHEQDMSQYRIRQYTRGIIQKVALWGKGQGFRVGIGKVWSHDMNNWEWRRLHQMKIPPVYMPGMWDSLIPTGTELLYFIW